MSDLTAAIRLALSMPDWPEALLAIYQQADAQIAQLLEEEHIACLCGGCCCRFDLQEHRLFASTLEFALLCADRPAELSRAQRRCCPYQQFTLCRARDRRPLGCRTFFCRDAARRIQELHEIYHRRIARLHEQATVPYLYCELTEGLLQFFSCS